LKSAEENKVQDLSMPVLGTGFFYTIEDFAKALSAVLLDEKLF